MRYWLALLFVCVGGLAEAAQPTLAVHSFTTSTSSSDTTASVTMTAGQAVVVIYVKSSTSNRTVSVRDDSGSNNYSSIVSAGTCATARCVEVLADYSVSGGTFTLTVDQSGTHVNYHFWILLFTCGTSCDNEGVSSLVGAAGTTHYSSADETVLDTGENSTLISACTSTGANIGTETPGAGWEALTGESLNHVFGQFEDDIATAFTNERGTFTTGNSVTMHCVIFAVSDSGDGGGAGAGGIPHLALIGTGL